MTTIPSRLGEMVADLYWRSADDARRSRNRKRTGEVIEVDAEKGVARVRLTEGGRYPPLLTGWIPWREQAMGAMRTHMPPSVGQQVVVNSENGDLTDAEIDTSLPSQEVERPSKSGDEFVLADVGGTRIVVTAGGVFIEAEKFEATTGSLEWTSGSVDFNEG